MPSTRWTSMAEVTLFSSSYVLCLCRSDFKELYPALFLSLSTGTIQATELLNMSQETMDAKQLQLLLNAADEDGDGEISLEEYLAVMGYPLDSVDDVASVKPWYLGGSRQSPAVGHPRAPVRQSVRGEASVKPNQSDLVTSGGASVESSKQSSGTRADIAPRANASN